MAYLSDREKLDLWNKVCIKNGWARPYEMDKWLLAMGIRFTPTGSVVPERVVQFDNKYNIEMQVNAVEGEMLATLVLEAMVGMVTFPSMETEKIFWDATKKKLNEVYEASIPDEVLPKYIREYEKFRVEDVRTIRQQPTQLELFEKEEIEKLRDPETPDMFDIEE